MDASVDLYPHSWWASWIGLWGIQDGLRSWRFRWGEVSFPGRFQLGYSIYHERASFMFGIPYLFSLFVNAPMWIEQHEETEDWCATYGLSWCGGLHINWRNTTKIIEPPWYVIWMKTEILSYGGASVWQETNADPKGMEDWQARHERRKVIEAVNSQTFDYTYTLLNGEVQHRKATVYISRMSWGWPRFGLPLRVRRYIEVSFDDEVGERTGSWKGGTIGCGYDMRSGETPVLCLRRMERERKF